jgi:hypothetical protein
MKTAVVEKDLGEMTRPPAWLVSTQPRAERVTEGVGPASGAAPRSKSPARADRIVFNPGESLRAGVENFTPQLTTPR